MGRDVVFRLTPSNLLKCCLLVGKQGLQSINLKLNFNILKIDLETLTCFTMVTTITTFTQTTIFVGINWMFDTCPMRPAYSGQLDFISTGSFIRRYSSPTTIYH